MRRTVLAGAALGVVWLTGTPALAAAPEVQQRSCEADGGTFTRDQGVKTCTTTTVGTRASVVNAPPYTQTVAGYVVRYTGTSLLTETVRTTTTRTQKGNGVVTTDSTSETLSWTIQRLTCAVEGSGMFGSFSNNDVPVDVCEHPENYSPDDLPFL
jgi:hypothetical protein